jgi:hypothetical protein
MQISLLGTYLITCHNFGLALPGHILNFSINTKILDSNFGLKTDSADKIIIVFLSPCRKIL